MSEASSRSSPATLDLFGNVISLPESLAGPTPSTSRDGPTTDLSGPAASLVSRFRARDSDVAMPTNDTSGPLFTSSSPSADLQRSLESRLRQSLAASGSPEFALTWSTWDLPSGVPICRLRASAHRTSGNGSTGWPSPQSRDGAHSRGGMVERTGGQRRNLDDYCLLSGWPTPRKCDDQGGPRVYDGKRGAALREAVAGWATPTAKDAADAGSRNTPTSKAHSGYSLSDQARGDFGTGRTAGWATPASRDYRYPNARSYQERSGTLKGEQLPNQVAHLAGWPTPNAMTGGQTSRSGERRDELLISGLTRSGSSASTAKRGALNPRFSLWLQGYETAWACCGEAVIRSSRKRPPSSSAQ